MFVLNWKDKRGYTLVELIISMAVLSIVALTIAILMRSGTSSYRNAKAEVDLQMESQTLLAQVNTMIMESDRAYYDATSHSLVLYQISQKMTPAPTSGAVPTASTAPVPAKFDPVKEVTSYKMIKFDATSKKLYLEEGSGVSAPATGTAIHPTFSEDELLSEYVESFEADIEGSNVTIKLGMKSVKQKYNTSATTKIRNSLK